MERQLLMGNQAIAMGALRAGVDVVTGYPGTPSTEILETIAKHNDSSRYVEWSVNEKAALEVAAGASYAGARTLVTMKQVGLNVASDPLMSLNYIGIKGGMVIVVADDPGPISSQTEQDTRQYAVFAKLPVFDPSTPEESYTMVADAFDFSEKYGTPVLLRPTTRVCHGCADVGILDPLPRKYPEGFIKDQKWVIFPRLSYQNHLKIENTLIRMSDDLSESRYNTITGKGNKGIACGGVSASYVKEALAMLGADCRLLRVGAYPFPRRLALEFLADVQEVLCVEELDPVIERELISLCGSRHLRVAILGKQSGHLQNAGENTVERVLRAVAGFLGIQPPPRKPAIPPPAELPVRPPVLCAGCPHRASFFAVKQACKGKEAVFSGDIGCYTLGNTPPLDMVDTCLCMGAGITIAQGLQRVQPDVLHFAFIGDSTFFHTGIPGIVNAVYNQADIIIVILDNATTAMTGSQPHPGTGITMMGEVSRKVDIFQVVSALGVSQVQRCNPFDLQAAQQAVRNAIDVQKGVRVILFEAPCITVSDPAPSFAVNREICTGCNRCVRLLGCPALVCREEKPDIDDTLCTGCSVCAGLCPVSAIKQSRTRTFPGK